MKFDHIVVLLTVWGGLYNSRPIFCGHCWLLTAHLALQPLIFWSSPVVVIALAACYFQTIILSIGQT